MGKKKKQMTLQEMLSQMNNPFSGRTVFHKPTKSHRKRRKERLKNKITDELD